MQIVGVTADKTNAGLRKPIEPEVSVPFTMGMGALLATAGADGRTSARVGAYDRGTRGAGG